MTERIIDTDELKVESEPADLSAAVGSLTAMIRNECADIDKTRAVPAVVTSTLRDLGVFRLLAPREIGGAEVDPVTFLKVIEAASYADGSVGWCVMIGGCYSTFGGMLPDAGHAPFTGIPPPSQRVRSDPTEWLERSTAVSG